MSPFLFLHGGMATPHPDDLATLSAIYPEPSFGAPPGRSAARSSAPNDRTLLTGVNVIARNVATPSTMPCLPSRGTSPTTSAGSPSVGVYTLQGLTPGADYAVYVDELLAGGFSTPPRLLPGPEEFYNGATESRDPATDTPGNTFTAVRRGPA